MYSCYYCIAQNFGGENFGKTIVIRQYFTQPNSRFTIVTNGSYCKFANVFLAKTLFAKVLSRQHFALYSIYCCYMHMLLFPHYLQFILLKLPNECNKGIISLDGLFKLQIILPYLKHAIVYAYQCFKAEILCMLATCNASLL